MEHEVPVGERRNPCRRLLGKAEGKRPLRRSRCVWWSVLKRIVKKKEGGVWTRFI